jgi:Nif-specific regulatory protein
MMEPFRSHRPRTVEHLENSPVLLAAATELLWRARDADGRSAYLLAALPSLSAVAGADYAVVAEANVGRWTTLGEVGESRSLPIDMLAEVIDQEQGGFRKGWIAAPLGGRGAARQAVALHCPAGADLPEAFAVLAALAPVLGGSLGEVDRRQRDARRIQYLEAILDIANEWNKTREVEPLLVKMAQAATRLLEADRASIFIWDRMNHVLVGKPALGVEGGELRVSDDRGVVGRVVQTGDLIRVDAGVDSAPIDREVDSQLGYRTKTVLCAPLRGSSGELFGAFELLNKRWGNFTADDEAALTELAAHAAIALENARDREKLISASRQISEQAAGQIRLIGNSPAIEALGSTIRRVADTDLAVLILGENGTGKEVVARSIHYLSRRRDKPFIAVNCAAIPDTLAESELFGHEKGAFTDAHEARLGKFELAADGTLFLDEIGDLSLSGQAKLLRVLEEKVLVRVGGSAPIHTDARVVTATNQNLAEMVRERRFREDLFFRLNVVTLDLPPLRERRDDVMLLAGHFLDDFSKKARRRVPVFSASARARLETHNWPGNVRELRNLMERLAYLSTGDRIEAEDLAFVLSPQGETPLVTNLERSLAEVTADFQVQCIQRAIEQSGGNMSQAASRLGLHRSNMYRKMRQLGMPLPRQQDGA